MKADLIIFAGQSNMGGRGNKEEAPEVPKVCGWEARTVTDPQRLYPIEEPFGMRENRTGGINDRQKKSGSMVSSFVNAYFKETGRPVLAVSASEGGTSIDFWDPSGPAFADLTARYQEALQLAQKEKIEILHHIFLWMQGETDGDLHRTPEEYEKKLDAFFNAVKREGMEDQFLIPIGNYNGEDTETDYTLIRGSQIAYCQTHKTVKIASSIAEKMKAAGMMKDAFHYTQKGYNALGEDAGSNTGRMICQNDRRNIPSR